MNPNRLILILCLAGGAWQSPVMALAAPSKSSPLSAEVRHPVEEKTLEASFQTWIAQPGSEHFAVQFILNNPQSCLQALQQLAKSKPFEVIFNTLFGIKSPLTKFRSCCFNNPRLR